MKRLVITTLLVLALTVSAFAGSFADVPSNHWAYEQVNELVAAGLIQGYPDGTFKGQNELTRYEVATMIARLLDSIDAARAELVDQVDFMITDAILTSESGLSAAQAEDVQVILQAVIDNNADVFGGTTTTTVIETKELSVQQAAEVMDIVTALTGEFAPELYDLGVRVDGLEERVAALEADAPVVTFNGEFKTEFKDFSGKNIVFVGKDGKEGYYKSPFDFDPGEEPDYEVGENYKSSLDLNTKVLTDVLEADLNLKASSLSFLNNGGEGSFDFDGLDAVITGRDFTATIKKEQQEGMRPYLFGGQGDWDGEKVDGVVLETANGRYFLDGRPYDVDHDLDDEDDPSFGGFAFAGENELDFLGGFNLVYGYEKLYGMMLAEEDAADNKYANGLVGLYKEFEMGAFNVTPELAFSTGGNAGHYVAVNADGALGIIDTEFKVENISKDFRGIAELLNQNTVENTTFISAEGKISDENALNFVGFDVTADAAFRSFTTVDDATSAVFNLTAKNAYLNDKLDVTGKLEYQDTSVEFDAADDAQAVRDVIGIPIATAGDGVHLYEEDEDKFDKSAEFVYNFSDALKASALYKLNKDNDLSEHDYKVDYAQGIITAGVKLDIEAKDTHEKETHFYAGLNADKAESYDLIGLDVVPYAEYKVWTEMDATNIIAGVETSKALGKYAKLSAGYDWQDIENMDDIDEIDEEEYDTGTLNTAFVGLSYDITEDVTADAEYRKLKFDADNLEDYEADLISAGVTIAF